MAILYMTGAEAGNAQYYYDGGWDNTTDGSFLSSTVAHQVHGQGGGYSHEIGTNGSAVTPLISLDPSAPRWLHFWIDAVSSDFSLTWLNVYGSGAFSVALNSDGSITWRNAYGTQVHTSVAGSVSFPGWFEIEMLSQDSGGVVRVYQDGALVDSYTGDTASNPQGWCQVAISTGGGVTCLDDLIIEDSGGGLIPECVISRVPAASDVTTALTPSGGGGNYAQIDELPPSTADYVEGTAVAEDVYGLGALPLADQVVAVAAWGLHMHDGGDLSGEEAVLRSGAHETRQSSLLTAGAGAWNPTVAIFADAPGGSGWAPADLATLQLGVRVRD